MYTKLFSNLFHRGTTVTNWESTLYTSCNNHSLRETRGGEKEGGVAGLLKIFFCIIFFQFILDIYFWRLVIKYKLTFRKIYFFWKPGYSGAKCGRNENLCKRQFRLNSMVHFILYFWVCLKYRKCVYRWQ